MIYKARGYNDGVYHYIGNRKMLVCESGAELTGIYAGSYSAPCFGSLLFSKEFESESQRQEGSLSYTHDVYMGEQLLKDSTERSEVAPIKLLDYMDGKRQIFVRESFTCGEYQMHFVLAPYVKVYEYKKLKLDYNERLFVYVIPANCNYYESFLCHEEIRVIVACRGDCEFDGRNIKVHSGRAQIIICSGTAPEATENMKYALKHARDDYNESPIYKAAMSEHRQCFERAEKLGIGDTLASVLSRQSISGGIISSHNLPLCDIKAFPTVCRVFEKLQMTREREALVDYWMNVLLSQGTVHSYHSLDYKDAFYDITEGASAAYALIGFCEYFTDNIIKAQEMSVLRNLFYKITDSFCIGALTYSGNESEMKYSIIPHECVFQGSAASTALGISACRKYIALARKKGAVVRKGKDSSLTRLEEAESAFESLFIYQNKAVINALKTERYVKRPRFVLAKCPACKKENDFAPATWLEKDRYGRYLCPDCFLKNNASENYSCERSELVLHLCRALSELRKEGKWQSLALERVKKYALEYCLLSESDDEKLPLRMSAQDLLVSKVLHLFGVENREFDEQIEHMKDASGAISELAVGMKFAGISADIYTTALYLENRLMFSLED